MLRECQEADRQRRGWGLNIPSRAAPPPKVSNGTISWGPSVQHMRLWGTFNVQTITLVFQPVLVYM